MARILLEIVASTVNDCIAAEIGGADRIELCAAIGAGGLTPSLGTLIEAKKLVRIPIMAMVRPRAGGFCYSGEEFATMLRDAALIVDNGADGVVFGILEADGRVDTERCAQLIKMAHGKQTVFHRAFDVVPDTTRALRELIELGFTRVLTSGQQKTAVEGREVIARLVAQAGSHIEVLAGGGIRAHNVTELLKATSCTEVHMTAFSPRDDTSTGNSPLSFGGMPRSPSGSYERVDPELVRRIREALDAITRTT